jgi:hypothetical protein
MRHFLRLLFLLLAASAPASIISFTASPTVFLPGQDVTLSWSVTAGDSISINQGVGAVSGATGSVTVLPSIATTFTLTDATSGTSAQVTVSPFAPPTLTHRWSFNEASGATATDSVGGSNGTLINATSGTNWTRVNSTGGTTSPDRVRLPGGASTSAPYIDLPDGIMSGLTQFTVEGWMTLNGAQAWSRYFDFGTNTSGAINGPGGSFSGTEYITLSAQVNTTTTSRRLSMKDNNVENYYDITGDTVTYGTEFHFACVYDPTGNNGSPRLSYYKNGALLGSLNTAFRPQDIVFVNNWLGRSNWSGDSNTNGTYNEFRIWSGPLSPGVLADEIASGPDALPSAPRINAFNAFPNTTIYRGSSVRLSYVMSDPANGALTKSIDNGVGTLAGNSGYATVTPMATTTYTLTVSNGTTSRTAAVTVTVLPSEPVTENLAVTAGYQTAAPVALVANDPNTPAGSLTYTIVNAPAHGTLSGTGANRTYTPAAGYSGPDSFIYKANDGTSDSNLATVTITVLPAPAAPTDIALSESAFFTNYLAGSFTGRLQATDANPDDHFTYALVAGAGATNNAYFSISGNQLISQHDFSGDLGQTISVRIRVTDSAGNAFEKILNAPVQARTRHVLINEINYNPARNTQLSEFIELYNPLDVAVDVSGWQFTKGVTFTFPVGTSITSHGYLVIASDPPTIQGLYGVTALGPWVGGLSGDGDDIVLKDAGGSKVDEVTYGITAPWPAPPNGDGPSLELVNPDADSDLGGNWRASTVAPTTVAYVTAGSGGWHYRKGTSEASSPVAAWRAAAFTEDGTWLTGTAPVGLFKDNSDTSVSSLAEDQVTLGTQLTDMATYSGGSFSVAYRSVFLRKTFTVSGTIPRSVLLRVMHNDAAVVWINGVEAGRFGFPPGSPADPPYNTTAFYERANDPWSEVVLLNAGNLLHAGTNVIAIEGFAKTPQPRSQQEDLTAYNVFDFCIDAELKNAPDILGTPGAPNSVLTANPPPAIRSVAHSPAAPKSWQPVTVTARISDPQGVGTVQLAYQVCAAGSFIPATLPLTNAQLLANPTLDLPLNPAFEAAANWTTIPMVDDGSVAGDIAGDGIFTAIIPAQAHRTLVRYRITATDLAGASARIPSADDPRMNFAYFVYNAVPNFVAGSQIFGSSALGTLPVYHWLTRSTDFTKMLAYNAADQFANTIDLNVLLARRFENFEGAMVVGDQVIDHTLARLRGGNSRYNGSGKRHFRFKFPKGLPLTAADEQGNVYPRPWVQMLFNKMFGNKGYYDFGLPYEVGARLWRLEGIPTPESHWVHFRVVQNSAEAPDATNGDFWGLYQALEFPDGKNFLKARDLPLGNFYKMSDWTQDGEMETRYQAAGAPDFAEDFDNIRYNVHQTASDTFIKTYVNMPLWYRYNAVQEAIRHYDIFTEPTGRHRCKNLIWWFQPKDGTNGLGYLWFMPYDWDASFGPNFNSGWDVIHNALYDHFDVTDSPTWALPKQTPRTAMSIEHRNAIRELRDLIWYRDGTGRGPFDDMVDDAVATIAAFAPADRARWPATGAVADYSGGVASKVTDMKNFAFASWTDTLGDGSPAVPAGGRAAYLDSISDSLDAGLLPATPTITYTGSVNYPIDGITLQSSVISDPQGSATFAGVQWRIGEITDPSAPAYVATDPRIYEVTAVWDSGEVSPPSPLTAAPVAAIPGTVLRAGHTYRARVRHKDNTGRWSHWSAPLKFTATASNYTQVLHDNLAVSEVMYRPAPPGAGYAESDYEYIELLNVSQSLTLNVTNVRFTKGIDFDFAGSAITSLAPGARVLVVKNAAAFASRYGAGKPIAGQWVTGKSLSNSGEQVKLSYGAGAAIQDFTYGTTSPWPAQSGTGGYSLVLKNPESHPDHAVATNWRASYVPGGTPGGDDRTNFDTWAAASGAADPTADPDSDGINNLLEYGLGGDPNVRNTAVLPQSAVQTVVVAGVPDSYLTLTFTRILGAEDITYSTEWSADMTTWNANGALVSSTDNLNGTVTETWRAPSPMSAGATFGRLRITRP